VDYFRENPFSGGFTGFWKNYHGGHKGVIFGSNVSRRGVSVISVSSVVDGLLHRLGELLDVFFGGFEGEGVVAGAEHGGGDVLRGIGEDALELFFGEDASGAGVGGEEVFLEGEGVFRESGEFFHRRPWQGAVVLGEIEVGGVEGGGIALKEAGDVELGVVFAAALGDVLVEG
jgi:hypothetical protein